MYTLNGIDLSTYGLIPGQADNSNYPLVGCWDMPARIGKTFHDWGNDADGIEPYVLADEIRFGGRDIFFTALMRTPSKNEALRTCYKLYADIGNANALAPFVTDLGTWNVYVKDEIQVQYISDGWCKLRIPFREPIVNLDGLLPNNKPIYKALNIDDKVLTNNSGKPIYIGVINNDGFGVDGIMFKELGLIILSIENSFNRPNTKNGQYTAYQNEGYKVAKTNTRQLIVKALIVEQNYSDYLKVITGLYRLFSKEGLRYITQEDDALRDFFVKDGFKVTQFWKYSNEVVATIEIQLTEVSVHTDWNVLNDANNQQITTEKGNIIFT